MEYFDNYIGKLLDNRYEILEKIGSGGMAVVYKARCHRLNRLVAVKILRPDFAQDEELRKRFHAESQAVAMLSNPNIVSVYDVGVTGNVDYIVMELIEGITLKQYITRKGILSWREALHFATQIAKALSHAHSRGIIHRDIKPHNIMILRDGSVKVADFGIATLLSNQNTLTQQALGSVHYISPEQAQGGHVDARTDIYSLGVVMYEMLTGRLPFEGESAVSIAIQHISSIPLSPREINPDIPAGLEMITMKAMEPNLSRRYETVDDLLFDLEEFRKNPDMVLNKEAVSAGVGAAVPIAEKPELSESEQPESNEPPPVAPVIKETSKPIKQKSKQKRVKDEGESSHFAPIIAIISLILVLGLIVYFMWTYFLKDLINREDVTVTLDNFVGKNIEEVMQNSEYMKKYDFSVTSEKNEEFPEGYIISQDPSADHQITPDNTGSKIEIKLWVSAGREIIYMPDIINTDYRAAFSKLDNLGLNLKIEMQSAPSEDIKSGYVIEQFPKEGEELRPGSTVFITYSTGPDIEYVEVPGVTGLTESKAILRLQSYNLSYKIQTVYDNSEPGTVIFQSYEAGLSVPIHTEVVLQVSLGPENPPEPDPDPIPPPTPITPTPGEGDATTPTEPEDNTND